MSPRLRLAIALAAVAAGLVNLALLLRAGDDRPQPLVYLVISVIGVSWSFVGAGLVAWTRRPENRTGALMVAVGLSYGCWVCCSTARSSSPRRPHWSSGIS